MKDLETRQLIIIAAVVIIVILLAILWVQFSLAVDIRREAIEGLLQAVQ